MANSAINISANAQEVINLRKRIDELKASLSSMRRSTDPQAYDKLNRELQTSSIRYNRLVGDLQRYVSQQQQAERATSKSSDSLTDLLKKGAALAGITFGAEKIRELGMEIVRVHGEMQQLNIAFSTMLKSQEKADALMSGLKTFATDTPFGLMDSAKGAKQLLAYGTTAENIIGDLKMLGNVASGVSAPLGDIVYLYGTLRSQGRAYAVDIRQFAGRGIPIYAELAKVLKVNVDQVNELVSAGKVGFPEVEQAFKNMTSGGGMFEGLMEKQTASVTGQIEKLKDNIQFMFDAIGTSSEGAIYGAIDGASTLVENYETVGKVLLGLIATYGAYKTTVILLSTVENIRYQSTLAQMAGYSRLAVITELLTAKTAALNKVLMNNAYAILAAAAVALAYGIYQAVTATSKLEDSQKRVNDITESFNASIENERLKLDLLFERFKNAKKGTDEYKKAKDDIMSQAESYQTGLSKEIDLLNDVAGAYKAISVAALQSAKDRAIAKGTQSAIDAYTEEWGKSTSKIQKEFISKFGKEQGSLLLDSLKDSLSNGKELSKEVESAIKSFDRIIYSAQGAAATTQSYQYNPINLAIGNIRDSKKVLDQEREELIGMFGSGSSSGKEEPTIISTYNDQLKSAQDNVSKLEKDLANLRKGIRPVDIKADVQFDFSKNIEEKAKELKDAQDKLSHLTTGQSYSASNKVNNAAETAAEKRLEAQRKIDEADRQRQSEKLAFDNEMRQKSIENMEDGFDKQSALLKLNYDKDIQAIEEYKDKMSKAQYTEAKNQYTSKHGDDKGFEGYFSSLKGEDLSKIMPSGLRPEDITANVNAYTKAANDAFDKGGRDINKNIALIMQEERLAFASELDQRLASVRAHFKDQKKAVENGSKDWIELNNLENQAIETVKAEHNTKLIQMDNEYKEKAIEISTDLFFFQSDKDAALLKQKIANNDKYINALKKEFTVQTKLDYDTLDEDVIDNLAKQYPDIVYAIRRAKQEQNGFNKEIAKTPAQKLKELKSLFDDISGVVGDITGVDFSMISNAIGGIASFAEKDYIGAASSGIGILSTAISGMVSQSAKHAAIQAEIVKLQQQYNIDLRQQNFDLVESINYARAFRQNLEALNWLVEKGFISDVDYSAWDALNEQYKIAQDNFEKASKSYEDYIKGSEDWLKSIDNETYLRYNKDAKGILKDWKNGVIDTEEAIKRMAETTNIGDLRDQINSAKEETDKWKDEIVDLSKQMDEFATGTEFDSFLSDAMSAMQDMKSGVADLADFTEDSLKNAVLSSFKYKVLSNALEPMYNQLADLFLADTLDKDAVSKWGVDLESLLGEYADKLEEVYKSLGLDFTNSSTSQSASSGYSTSMSQETGEAIEGRTTAMHMNLISIDGNVARIAEWAQPFDMKYNVDVLTAPLSALSESCQRIELMLEQNRNIAIQSYYELKDINKQTKELYPIRTGIDTMNKTLSNL